MITLVKLYHAAAKQGYKNSFHYPPKTSLSGGGVCYRYNSYMSRLLSSGRALTAIHSVYNMPSWGTRKACRLCSFRGRDTYSHCSRGSACKRVAEDAVYPPTVKFWKCNSRVACSRSRISAPRLLYEVFEKYPHVIFINYYQFFRECEYQDVYLKTRGRLWKSLCLKGSLQWVMPVLQGLFKGLPKAFEPNVYQVPPL